MEQAEKEKLEEAIGNGVTSGLLNFVAIIGIIAILAFIVVGGSIFAINYYSEQQFAKEHPEFANMSRNQEVTPSCTPYRYVTCYLDVGNETETHDLAQFGVCGYAEANAKLITYIPQLEKSVQIDFPTWKVTDVHCE